MVSEHTKKEDERLREELRHVDLEKLKKAIKPLVATNKVQGKKEKGERGRGTQETHAR